MPIPDEGEWFCKPQINLRGMGCGARRIKQSDEVPPGYIWMPFFQGIHLSVDYTRKEGVWLPRLIIQGIYRGGHPVIWSRVKIDPPVLPLIFNEIDVPDLNVEYIDSNVIEAHLRRNPDFEGIDTDIVIPVWQDTFHEKYENGKGWLGRTRIGFVYI